MHWEAVGAASIALAAVAGMLLRPWDSREWMWAVGGAAAEIALKAVTVEGAWAAVAGGAEVFAFLAGILVLAELARSQGVFDWLAGHADQLTGGSRQRLLLLFYAAGVLVTATLSNDTAIIVLTPAALALGRRIGGSPFPYVFACAFVANAASFLLPSGNPANLLLYGRALPPLAAWIGAYGLASAISIVLTYLVLAWSHRADLLVPCADRGTRERSTPQGRLALGLLGASSLALVVGSACGWPLGAIAMTCAVAAVAIVARVERAVVAHVVREVSWSIVPLVAGLLVIVAALEAAGVTRIARSALEGAAALQPWLGREAAGFATALLANAANNLPIAVFAARVLGGVPSQPLAHAVLAGVDLGPNLSVSGSLATLLWLMALRREGVIVTPAQFFLRGAPVMALALFGALLVVR